MPDILDPTPTNLTKSPDAVTADEANGRDVKSAPAAPDATAGQPVTAEPADQTPMVKPTTDAPAFAGPHNDDVPTPAEQAADTQDPEPLKGIEVEGPAPVLGAPIGVNPIVPQATVVVADEDAEPAPVIDVDPAMTEQHAVVPMRHPGGGAADGFDTDDDGRALVPAAQVETMKAHGFVVSVDEDHPIQEDDMKFTAPPHTTGVQLSSGPIEVVDGQVDVPDNAPEGDIAGLRASGFEPVPVTPAEKVAELVDTHTKAELLDKAADLDVGKGDPKPVIAEAIVNAGIVPLVAGATEQTGVDPVAGAAETDTPGEPASSAKKKG